MKTPEKLPRVLTGANVLRMIGIGLACLAFILATSCKTTKQVNKKESKQEQSSDSVYNMETNIVEYIDSGIVIQPDTTTTEIDQSDLWGQTFETPTLKIILGPKKTKTGKQDLTVITKPKIINAKVDRRTTIKSQGAVKKEARTEEKSKEVTKERWQLPWWVWVLAMVAAFWGFRKLKWI